MRLSDVPHIEQYSGAWAVEETCGQQLLAAVRLMDMGAHIVETQAKAAESKPMGPGDYYTVSDGVAVVDHVGVMTKYGSSLAGYPGTLRMRRTLRAAAADNDVRAIMLRIDSPGGSVSGAGDLADDVAEISKSKPVWAYIEDMGASAAYQVASQATRIIANSDAAVGSIGAYMVIQDYSKAFADAGVKTYVVKTGQFKGAGAEGTEITADQLVEWQRNLDAIHEQFVGRVARGRRMSAEKAALLADGRLHIGQHAQENGLVDEIGTFDAALASLSAMVNKPAKPGSRKEARMSETKNADVATQPPATLAELKAAFPGANADWLLGQIEAGATMQAAVTAYAGVLAAREEALRDRESRKPIGVEPIGNKLAAKAEPADDDPVEAFDAAVRSLMVKGASRDASIAAVAKADPDLHRDYLLAVNTGKKARRQISEKYDNE